MTCSAAAFVPWGIYSRWMLAHFANACHNSTDGKFCGKLGGMGRTLYTSDTHIGHDKDFIVAARGHDTVADHDRSILEHWKSHVTNEDTVVFGGDMLMGPDKLNRAAALLQEMPYKTLHWIQGNHDPRFDKLQEMLPAGRDVHLYPMGTNPVINGRTVSHFPPGLIGVRPDDQRDFMKHAPAVEPGEFVHGHTHSTTAYAEHGDTKMHHVGWDSHHRFVELP